MNSFQKQDGIMLEGCRGWGRPKRSSKPDVKSEGLGQAFTKNP